MSARVCQRDDPLVDRDASVARLMGAQESEGDALRQIGKFVAARDRFNAALALDRKLERPGMAAQAQWGLAQIEKDSGDPALAAAMFAEIAGRRPPQSSDRAIPADRSPEGGPA
jgi:hypothetical protein